MPSAATPGDDVDIELKRLLTARAADGSLKEEARLWGLERPAAVRELQLLATTSVAEVAAAVPDSDGVPALVDRDRVCPLVDWYMAHVPLLFEQLRDRLFVGTLLYVVNCLL